MPQLVSQMRVKRTYRTMPHPVIAHPRYYMESRVIHHVLPARPFRPRQAALLGDARSVNAFRTIARVQLRSNVERWAHAHRRVSWNTVIHAGPCVTMVIRCRATPHVLLERSKSLRVSPSRAISTKSRRMELSAIAITNSGTARRVISTVTGVLRQMALRVALPDDCGWPSVHPTHAKRGRPPMGPLALVRRY